jgi:pantoate--beta-alanine ligase
LALSSRNRLLTAEERAVAPALYRALSAGLARIQDGERDAKTVRAAAIDSLQRVSEIRVQYLEVADAATMRPVEKITGPVRIAAAVWLGKVRLIDNVLFTL